MLDAGAAAVGRADPCWTLARIAEVVSRRFGLEVHGGSIVLIWDNLSTPVSRTMRELIDARLWLTAYQLPPYAPEFNPVDGAWSLLKRSLANLTKHSLDELPALVKTRLKRMQYGPRLVDGLIAKTGLDLRPPASATSAVEDL